MYRHPTLHGLLVLLALCTACSNPPPSNNARNDGGPANDSGSSNDGGTVSPPNDGGIGGPCNSVYEGTYLLSDQAALDALAEYCEVTGTLSVYDSSLTSFSVPQLTTVGRALSVLNNDALTSFSFPNLRSVGDSVTVERNNLLTSFEFSALTEVGEGQFDNVFIKHNDALTSFDLSALMRVTGSLFVRFNAALTSFDLSALTGLGGFLGITDNGALAQCLVDALVAQVEAGEGMGNGVDTSGGPNNLECTCEEVAGVLRATCP